VHSQPGCPVSVCVQTILTHVACLRLPFVSLVRSRIPITNSRDNNKMPANNKETNGTAGGRTVLTRKTANSGLPPAPTVTQSTSDVTAILGTPESFQGERRLSSQSGKEVTQLRLTDQSNGPIATSGDTISSTNPQGGGDISLDPQLVIRAEDVLSAVKTFESDVWANHLRQYNSMCGELQALTKISDALTGEPGQFGPPDWADKMFPPNVVGLPGAFRSIMNGSLLEGNLFVPPLLDRARITRDWRESVAGSFGALLSRWVDSSAGMLDAAKRELLIHIHKRFAQLAYEVVCDRCHEAEVPYSYTSGFVFHDADGDTSPLFDLALIERFQGDGATRVPTVGASLVCNHVCTHVYDAWCVAAGVPGVIDLNGKPKEIGAPFAASCDQILTKLENYHQPRSPFRGGDGKSPFRPVHPSPGDNNSSIERVIEPLSRRASSDKSSNSSTVVYAGPVPFTTPVVNNKRKQRTSSSVVYAGPGPFTTPVVNNKRKPRTKNGHRRKKRNKKATPLPGSSSSSSGQGSK